MWDRRDGGLWWVWGVLTVMDGAKEPDRPTIVTRGRGVRAQLDDSGGSSVIGDRIQR